MLYSMVRTSTCVYSMLTSIVVNSINSRHKKSGKAAFDEFARGACIGVSTPGRTPRGVALSEGWTMEDPFDLLELFDNGAFPQCRSSKWSCH